MKRIFMLTLLVLIGFCFCACAVHAAEQGSIYGWGSIKLLNGETLTDITQIDAGQYHSLAMKSDGSNRRSSRRRYLRQFARSFQVFRQLTRSNRSSLESFARSRFPKTPRSMQCRGIRLQMEPSTQCGGSISTSNQGQAAGMGSEYVKTTHRRQNRKVT